MLLSDGARTGHMWQSTMTYRRFAAEKGREAVRAAIHDYVATLHGFPVTKPLDRAALGPGVQVRARA
jgi:hypothetical protein